ncbi:RHS repeat-associated core domain protein [Leptospira interrogans serovar Grippotyphosa str. UI 12764]|nr:RHS repeat-associated core domain protein [Leptospira interrogans serovar Grippotyphosa str. UI 12764]
MGANVAPGVPSIQNPGVGMTGGGSVGGMPVTGMYFYHPNHLGSITMITDGAGNPASGPEPGVSYVSYEPYGSIIRNDSYGPDIFRYKFTGQIEDKETGLYYYKARYYEPTLGRFLQADSIIQPESVNGMNRYMYVDGNPVSYRDPSGHISGPDMMHMLNRIVGHAMGKDFNSKGLDKKLSTGGVKKGFDKYIGKNGILGYLGDHLVTAPLKRLIISTHDKRKIRKQAREHAVDELTAEFMISRNCGSSINTQDATQEYIQSYIMAPYLSKFAGDSVSRSLMPGRSELYLLGVSKLFKFISILKTDTRLAKEASCEKTP